MAPCLEWTTQALVTALAALPPLYTLTIPKARQFLEDAQANYTIPPNINQTSYKLPIGPTGSVQTYLYRPASSSSSPQPVIIYFHGGGWILGSHRTHARLVTDLALGTSAAVFFIEYTNSPEAAFPVPIQQAHAAATWVSTGNNAKNLGLDKSKIAFAGDSAGGAMSAAVNILSIRKNRLDLLPKTQVLFYPVTDVSRESATYREFYDGPGLAVKTLRWMKKAFVPTTKNRRNPLASPALASDEVLKKFPETTVITAEVDPLRQEGEDFARRLSKLRVDTTIVRVIATVHDFVLLNALKDTPASRVGIEIAVAKIKKAFE